eukprot:3434410-Amphidinium_carterae.2
MGRIVQCTDSGENSTKAVQELWMQISAEAQSAALELMPDMCQSDSFPVETQSPDESPLEPKEAHPFPATSKHGLQVLVRQAHERMGHPSKERFLRILRNAGASERVLQEARDMKCSVCEQMVLPSSQRRSAGTPCIGFNQTVGADLFFLTGSTPSEKIAVLSVICWGTVYQVCTIVPNKGAKEVRKAYLDSWIKHFGPPRRLVTDQGTEFTAAEFTERLTNEATQHELTATDTPWQNGRTERAGGIIKMMVSKMRMAEPPRSLEEMQELLTAACTAKNRFSMVGGHAPYQRVFGSQMRIPGTNLGDELDDADVGMMSAMEAGESQIVRSTRLRTLARDAFNHLDAAERIRRCILSGPRPLKRFNPGELVYMWKRSGDVHAFRIEHRHCHWHGPCTVIGHHRAKIWLNYRGHLWLCSPEQVRPATLEETAAQKHLGEELDRLSDELAVPGARFYSLPEDDRTGAPEPSTSARLGRPADVELSEEEVEEEEGPHHEEGQQSSMTLDRSARGRSPGPTTHHRGRSPGTPVHRQRSRTRGRSLWNHAFVMSEIMTAECQKDEDLCDVDLTCNSTSPYACIFIAGKDETAKRKEISFLHLKKSDQDRFRVAMNTEWTNVLQPQSAKLLDLQESVKVRNTPSLSDRIVPTRWVLVEKDMGPAEPTKAKARLVLQGFRDPDLHDLDVSSPTLSKDSLPIVLQVIACQKWKLLIADIKGAFMKSRPLNRKQGPLYAAMPSMGSLPADPDRVQLIEILCAWYGLNDGPREFYVSFHEEVSKLGCRRSILDPCVYTWFNNGKCEGIFGVTVDDMVCGGTALFRSCVIDQLNKRFPFGKLCEGSGRFTGRDLSQDEDGNITISQVEYVKGLEPINIPRSRRQNKSDALTSLELTMLRGKVGELNWLQGVSRPDLSGSVSMLQGCATKS